MVDLTGIFSHFKSQKIVVAGDLILDSTTFGKVKRISPEAPVPVVNVYKSNAYPGGAGNVITNLCSLGAEVTVIGRIGHDFYGQSLIDLLLQEKVDVRGIITQENYTTPMKNRIIASNQQLVRIDHEEIVDLSESHEQYLIENLEELLRDAKALAISDYGKGFLTPCLLKALIHRAQSMNIPVVADPKGIDFTKYQGVTILKPNLSEAYAAAGKSANSTLSEVAASLLKISNAKTLMITQSENGITNYFQDGSESHFPVLAKEVKDVTGAGDTVLATITYSLANNLSLQEATKMANIAAATVIEKIGCARITLKDLAHRLLEIDYKNKIFSDKNLFVLKILLEERECKILTLNCQNGLTSKIFESLFQVSDSSSDLLIYLEGDVNDDILRVLSSLKEVTYILMQSSMADLFLKELQPSHIQLLEKEYTESFTV